MPRKFQVLSLGTLAHNFESLGHSSCDPQVILMNVRELSMPPRATGRRFCLPGPLWCPPITWPLPGSCRQLS